MPNNKDSAAQLAWERGCSIEITSDILWKLDVYRAALFLLHLAKSDVRSATRGVHRSDVAAQLISAAGSIAANIGEGYSRSTRADRLRFFGYALGSTRECIAWYLTASDTLESLDTIDARLVLLSRIRALLLGLIRSHRTPRSRNDRIRFEP